MGYIEKMARILFFAFINVTRPKINKIKLNIPCIYPVSGTQSRLAPEIFHCVNVCACVPSPLLSDVSHAAV